MVSWWNTKCTNFIELKGEDRSPNGENCYISFACILGKLILKVELVKGMNLKSGKLYEMSREFALFDSLLFEENRTNTLKPNQKRK